MQARAYRQGNPISDLFGMPVLRGSVCCHTASVSVLKCLPPCCACTPLYLSPRFTNRLPVGLSTRTHSRVQSSRDRKSTRLNSSHVRISYAVFCLKKKKQSNQ